MRRPPFPFAMMLTRSEEERDEQRRVYLKKRERWREQQRAVATQERALVDLLGQLGAHRATPGLVAVEQNHLLYMNRERQRLHFLTQREEEFAAGAEEARKSLLKASLKVRVWESLRERFWKEWEVQQRRREEAELEDWSRSRLKLPRSRAVV